MAQLRHQLRAAARWNEAASKVCYDELKKAKNHGRRAELYRNAYRFTKNAIVLNKTANGRLY